MCGMVKGEESLVIGYIGKRMIAIIPIVFIATLVTFGLIHISPVDPAEAYLTAKTYLSNTRTVGGEAT